MSCARPCRTMGWSSTRMIRYFFFSTGAAGGGTARLVLEAVAAFMQFESLSPVCSHVGRTKCLCVARQFWVEGTLKTTFPAFNHLTMAQTPGWPTANKGCHQFFGT